LNRYIGSVRLAALATVMLGCASPPASTTQGDGPDSMDPTTPQTAVASAAPSASASSAAKEEAPRISAKRALELWHHAEVPDDARACMKAKEDREQIVCLLRLRLADDRAAADAAVALYDEVGTVVGLEREHVMDGGWRGHIRLVPQAPTGRDRRHLEWLLSATRDFNEFFTDLETRGDVDRYRWHPIELRFFRSVGRTTPSAYAANWGIAYNVSGSLHSSADAVRETLFHEVFHLNDDAHGDWSREHLTPTFDSIMERCSSGGRPSTPCLAPFAPGDTMVRGGTFYAFQPGNGVWEYAAELAVRYYREHREVLAGRALAKAPFKCGPEENARVWKLFVAEFFAGIDATPACPR
jgi:hypothetical protein